jgi:hypothetical protein
MKTKDKLWEDGYDFAQSSESHPDQDRQTFWNRNVLYGDMTYDEYCKWEEGYYVGNTTKILFPN